MARKAARRDERDAKGAEGSAKGGHVKSGLRENFEAVIFAVLFALFVRTFIAQPYKIPSGSMEDSLLVGDHLIVNKVAFGSSPESDGPAFLPTRPVRRGDVVIFRPPNVPGVADENSDYIKRVIGLPGETLVLLYDAERDGVRVVVDGVPLPESWRDGHFGEIHHEPGALWTVTFDRDRMVPERGQPMRQFRLGPAEYFVMGDNRNGSADSRFWGERHAVRAERLRGLAWVVYWSYDVGDDDPEPQGLARRLAHYAKIAVTFPFNSRWERTFRPIR